MLMQAKYIKKQKDVLSQHYEAKNTDNNRPTACKSSDPAIDKRFARDNSVIPGLTHTSAWINSRLTE